MLNPLYDICYVHTGAFTVKGRQMHVNAGIQMTDAMVLMGIKCKLYLTSVER